MEGKANQPPTKYKRYAKRYRKILDLMNNAVRVASNIFSPDVLPVEQQGTDTVQGPINQNISHCRTLVEDVDDNNIIDTPVNQNISADNIPKVPDVDENAHDQKLP
ncbi:uncharacterized protein [Diabrotica undecimpunctata]|uniref:uncharacterized protein n=1 Tax=Diabrotica undecimpunctata TaxID=50387 RepID=UPI003B637EC0